MGVYAKNFDSKKAVENWSKSNFGARGVNTMLLVEKSKRLLIPPILLSIFLMTLQKRKHLVAVTDFQMVTLASTT